MKISIAVVFGILSYAGLGVAAEHVVTQKGKAFDKESLTIAKGDTVKFVNADDTAHHLMMKADGKRVNVKQPQGAEPLVQTFTTAQKTTVRCAIHPKMKLKLEVK